MSDLEAFIERVALNEDARKANRLDIIDNSQMTRLKGMTKKDFDRTIRYQKAFVYLSD